MAVNILRGNTVIKLLIILDIPTASESSISILQETLLCACVKSIILFKDTLK